MKWVHRIFAILTLGPWVVWLAWVALALGLSYFGGCRIDESGVHPCTVAGREAGELAYTAGFWSAWGVMLIGPFSFGFGLTWAMATFVAARIRRHRQPPAA
ncbi:hypothetical protein [Psychromarinibacter halotolerans]|uniref:Vitamin K epoxide reductase family protein n=1 Tax=Psychromarinibacter halotolerans TaxID=1775175 RepID=A0ABV7GXE3_9RHOB|nr:hypothetical protein [Psychromarinibacter halotolerans]MAQ82125.1 hypothetical protein [Maritimibacter sp.]MAQ83159.1 hypothetical protein [Maritimibacter sp.]MDF0598051.1 hypothetical protein [Psychromarinibacter halotolerans]